MTLYSMTRVRDQNQRSYGLSNMINGFARRKIPHFYLGLLPICKGMGYLRFRTGILKSHSFPSMWPILIEFIEAVLYGHDGVNR